MNASDWGRVLPNPALDFFPAFCVFSRVDDVGTGFLGRSPDTVTAEDLRRFSCIRRRPACVRRARAVGRLLLLWVEILCRRGGRGDTGSVQPHYQGT
jgi:hypothetical protein